MTYIFRHKHTGNIQFFVGGNMKFKFLSILCLAAIAGLAGCGGSENTNKANVNANANVVTNTATAPMKDAAFKQQLEDALAKKAGITDVRLMPRQQV